jgi:hypothetical protein
MPIVINEFEIVIDPPPSSKPDTAAPQSRDEQPPALRPDEIAAVMQVREERQQRVRAN